MLEIRGAKRIEDFFLRRTNANIAVVVFNSPKFGFLSGVGERYSLPPQLIRPQLSIVWAGARYTCDPISDVMARHS